MANVLMCLNANGVGGIQQMCLELHLYDKDNRYDFWAADDGVMSEIMRKAGMMVWSGGPPQELQDSHYYDVVVGNTVGGWSHRDLFTWAKDRGAKTIECMHSNCKSPTPPELVDGFIALNRCGAYDLNPQMPNRAVIYGIVKPELFDVKPTGNYIGRMSRIVEEKRPWEFREIADSFPSEHFVLAGDGNMRGKILASAPTNLLLPGTIRQFDKFYETLKLFAFPSRDECCCVSVAMCQASGVPVICQDIPPLRETTGGYAVFANNHEEFIDCVRRFLGDSSGWRDMANEAREFCRNNFHPKVVVSQWKQMFESIGVR